MNYLKFILALLNTLFLTACMDENSNIFDIKLSKGDLLLNHSTYKDRYNYIYNSEFVLLKLNSNQEIELSKKGYRYSFEIVSLSPSGNNIILIDEQNKSLTLLNLVKGSNETILKNEMSKNIKPEFVTRVEFLNDTIALIAADNNLFKYNIYRKDLSKIANFNNFIISDIFIPKFNRQKILLNFIDAKSNDTIIDFSTSYFDYKDGKLLNEEKINLTNIFDISGNGEYLVGWDDSIYVYNCKSKLIRIINLESKLNYMAQHKIKFFDDNSIILIDTYEKGEKYYSKLLTYNFIEKKIVKEFMIGEGYYEIIKLL